jgi:hypothetical protein
MLFVICVFYKSVTSYQFRHIVLSLTVCAHILDTICFNVSTQTSSYRTVFPSQWTIIFQHCTYITGDYHEHYVQTGHQYVLSYMGAGVAQSIQRLTTHWKTGRPGFDVWQSQRIFLLASVSRAALGPIQALMQWVSWVLQRAKSGRGVTLTTHFHLVMRLSTSRSYISYSPCRMLGSIGTALHEAWNILWII